MQKEDILKKSHNTFKNSDPYEIHLKSIGQLIGCAVALIVNMFIFFLQQLLQEEWNFALIATVPLLLAVKSTLVGIKLRKKKVIVEAIIFGAIAITLIAIHILSFSGV